MKKSKIEETEHAINLLIVCEKREDPAIFFFLVRLYKKNTKKFSLFVREKLCCFRNKMCSVSLGHENHDVITVFVEMRLYFCANK